MNTDNQLQHKIITLAKSRACTHRVTLRLDPLYFYEDPHFGKADKPFKTIPYGPERSWLYDQMSGRLLRPWPGNQALRPSSSSRLRLAILANLPSRPFA